MSNSDGSAIRSAKNIERCPGCGHPRIYVEFQNGISVALHDDGSLSRFISE